MSKKPTLDDSAFGNVEVLYYLKGEIKIDLLEIEDSCFTANPRPSVMEALRVGNLILLGWLPHPDSKNWKSYLQVATSPMQVLESIIPPALDQKRKIRIIDTEIEKG